ncbi:DeoR/GlpR family DNA-binding transcription regulator [Chitinophagaceae bacterium LWZ2-11]
MLKKERQAYIVQQINIHNKVLSSDLSGHLNVSEDTIRRDLQELHEEGKLNKVHGGALSKSFHFTIQNNDIYSLPEKKIIAHKAMRLIKDGMFIVLSGGTTIRELIKALPEELNATFITASVPTAMELLNHPNIEVIFVGNKLLKSSQMSVGAEVITRLGEIQADLCFLGTNSIDVTEGITDLEWEVIEVKRAMINCAHKTVSLAISEKLNTVQRLKVCPLKDVDILITELPPENDQLKAYHDKGVEVL